MKKIATILLSVFLAGTAAVSARTNYQAWITTDGAGILLNSNNSGYYPRTLIGYDYDDDYEYYRYKKAKKHYKKYKKAQKKYRKAQKKYWKAQRKHRHGPAEGFMPPPPPPRGHHHH